MKITKKSLEEYMDRRNDVKIKLLKDLDVLVRAVDIQRHRGKGRGVRVWNLKGNTEMWLGGNIILQPEGRFGSSEFEQVSYRWRMKFPLIPIHNNPNGLTSIMTSSDPYISIPGMYYISQEDLLLYAEYVTIGDTVKFEDVKKLVEKHKAEIIKRHIVNFKKCIKNKEFDTRKFFQHYEDTYFSIPEFIFEKEEGADLIKVDMSENHFNDVQNLLIEVQEEAMKELSLDTTILQDIGVLVI